MPLHHVDDPGDPRIADFRNVPDPVLLETRGLFIAEGRLVVRRLLAEARLATRAVMVTRPAYEALQDVLAEAQTFLVPQPVMNAITGFNIHRGCLAIGERPPALEWQTVAATARRLVVLERVGNADNVGAIFRNAAAFAADAVLLGPGCTDPLYRKAIRTSMAAALSVPFAAATPWPEALRTLATHGFHVVALSPCPGAPPLRHVAAALTTARVAVVAGHEGEGLTRDAMDACTARARIPMTDRVDSLNVATAIALALYELGR